MLYWYLINREQLPPSKKNRNKKKSYRITDVRGHLTIKSLCLIWNMYKHGGRN